MAKKVKVDCGYCGGDRVVPCDCTGGMGKKAADDDCLACGGEGEHTCPSCDGTGYWIEEW